MLIVDTLGRFHVNDGKNILIEENIHSEMLMKLMMYVILNRERLLSIDELSEILWQGDSIDNPAGALKNLMYRLRTLLKKHFGEQDFIISKRGAYAWNSKVTVVIDIDEFEKMHKIGENQSERIEKRKQCFERAISLYQGRFMNGLYSMHWMISISAYYHSIFLSCIKGLAQILQQDEQFDKLERLITKALKQDSLDEELYYYQMLSLMYQNKLKLADEAYEKAVKILSEELGIANCDILKEAHNELLSLHKTKKAENIKAVYDDIVEDNVEGVFLCEYPVFREIFRLEARKMERIDETEHIILFTLKHLDGIEQKGNQQILDYRQNHGMDKLEQVLKKSLRIGDVAAKYSGSQYIVLLSRCTYESALLVTSRIISLFQEKNPHSQFMTINYNLEIVTSKSMLLPLIGADGKMIEVK